VSLFAGFATTPYAAYHFHRLAPYGVLANLLAMPIVSAWVMPAGIVALIAMPFGFDAPVWRLMGGGIEWMDAVALWVASLPGAVGRMAAFGTGPLLLATAGLILACLLRSPLRWSGALLLAAAAILAVRTPQPDVLVAEDGRTFAVRTAQGRLAVLRNGYDTLTTKDWLAADADPRNAKDADLKAGLSCDQLGCTAKLADGRIVAMALTAEAFDEDCRRAALVVSPRGAPPGCATAVVDRTAWRAHGAITLRATETGFSANAVRPTGVDRPWARATEGSERPIVAQGAAPVPPLAAEDATPVRDESDAD
jgi:competence protein ComEC